MGVGSRKQDGETSHVMDHETVPLAWAPSLQMDKSWSLSGHSALFHLVDPCPSSCSLQSSAKPVVFEEKRWAVNSGQEDPYQIC